MLYENVTSTGERVPAEIFPLGFYPIAEVSTRRWGSTSVAVEPLTRSSLLRALKNGRMVFIASHGGTYPGAISLSPDPGDSFLPGDIQSGGGVGPKLQFVYIAGCYAGTMEPAWRQSLAPAQVILFNRISLVLEHVNWLWFIGPRVVSGLE